MRVKKRFSVEILYVSLGLTIRRFVNSRRQAPVTLSTKQKLCMLAARERFQRAVRQAGGGEFGGKKCLPACSRTQLASLTHISHENISNDVVSARSLVAVRTPTRKVSA